MCFGNRTATVTASRTLRKSNHGEASHVRPAWHGAPDDPAFTPRQALLVAMCDELHETATLSDPTWSALRAAYADDELVELVCLAGFYHLVSFACGAFAVEAEPWAIAAPAAVG